jgi:hypothetical protein
VAKRTLEQRKTIKVARRAKKTITGGLSGNAQDRRRQRRRGKSKIIDAAGTTT